MTPEQIEAFVRAGGLPAVLIVGAVLGGVAWLVVQRNHRDQNAGVKDTWREHTDRRITECETDIDELEKGVSDLRDRVSRTEGRLDS